MSELKNCQCGCSKPHVIRHELLNTGYAYFNVACGECQITQTTDYPTEADAITAWNTRTAAPRFTEGERELKALDDYWFWETPFEANHLESMVDTLKVVISAADLKYLIKKTALRAQGEAGRKIEKVREICKSVLAWSDFEPIPGWMIAQNRVANDILKILEGAE